MSPRCRRDVAEMSPEMSPRSNRCQPKGCSPGPRPPPGPASPLVSEPSRNLLGTCPQAASIIEALEGGASALLLDEDTSATNFMIRDARMQALVSADREPIRPFITRVRSLWSERGVSTVLVVGGSGDYFDVADTAQRALAASTRSSHRHPPVTTRSSHCRC